MVYVDNALLHFKNDSFSCFSVKMLHFVTNVTSALRVTMPAAGPVTVLIKSFSNWLPGHVRVVSTREPQTKGVWPLIDQGVWPLIDQGVWRSVWSTRPGPAKDCMQVNALSGPAKELP